MLLLVIINPTALAKKAVLFFLYANPCNFPKPKCLCYTDL